jgi:hypothetical protein
MNPERDAQDQNRATEAPAADSEVLDRAVRSDSARRTRRSFVVSGIIAAGAYGLYRWLDRARPDGRQPWPLRQGFEADAAISRAVFGDRSLAPTYSLNRARELRVNGNYGLKEEIAPENYRLQVVGVANARAYPQYVDDVTAWDFQFAAKAEDKAHEGHETKEPPKMPSDSAGRSGSFGAQLGTKRARGQEEAGRSNSSLPSGTPGLLLTIEDLNKLPRQELVTQFKCIEGWSEIVHWGGVRLADFIAAYPPVRRPDGAEPRYLYMETPDGDYYCGFDLEACLHPQSLLVTEMSGEPLPQWHGAPLRLHMPIKYGYKQIKRIGLIAYTDQRPDDYWTKLGYDWHAGL